MAARRKTRARDAQIGFEALSIEGGLLADECGRMLSSFFAARRGRTLVA